MRPAVITAFSEKRVKVQEQAIESEELTTLRAICVVLQAVAQKYVPDYAFEDRSNLLQCLKIMRELGISFAVKAKFSQFFDEKDTDRCSLSYRVLKNKTIAALSTIADLDKKCLERQGGEYKNGMRDAYKRASAIAIMFLEEIQGDALADSERTNPRVVHSKPRCGIV